MKKTTKKLSLSRETIKNLNGNGLEIVLGGTATGSAAESCFDCTGTGGGSNNSCEICREQ